MSVTNKETSPTRQNSIKMKQFPANQQTATLLLPFSLSLTWLLTNISFQFVVFTILGRNCLCDACQHLNGKIPLLLS
jgi:hypothetical protein